MTAQPLVSVIVPSFNQGAFIRETLESIFQQDYPSLEVIVVDGASSDETVEILREFAARHRQLRWLSEPDDGVVDAVNKGLALARGEFAAIQSSDDLYKPGMLSEAVAELQSDPGLAFVCGEAEIINEQGEPIRIAPNRAPLNLASLLARTSIVHQSSTLFRLALAQQLGGWNPQYFCADTELWLRMLQQAPARRVSRVWSCWRRHPNQRDTEAHKMLESWRQFASAPYLSSARLRRAARAGQAMLAFQYRLYRSNGQRRRLAWQAILNYPAAFHQIRPKVLLWPGLGRIWRPHAGRFEDSTPLD